MYTLDIPFIYYGDITTYTFYLILLENSVHNYKRGLIYLQNKEIPNTDKSYTDIRCIYNNTCIKDDEYIIPKELIDKFSDVITKLIEIVSLNYNQDIEGVKKIKELIKLLVVNEDVISQFNLDDYQLTSAFKFLRLIYSINIPSLKNRLNASLDDKEKIKFYKDILNAMQINNLSDYFKCSYFGMDESWSRGRVDEAHYCIKLVDKYINNNHYKTYVDILHSHPRCDFEKYTKFKKLDVIFTLIYKVLTTINYKGEIYIQDASKYYIDIPSNLDTNFKTTTYKCKTITDDKLDTDDEYDTDDEEYESYYKYATYDESDSDDEYDQHNLYSDRDDAEKTYISFETCIFLLVTKNHTIYNNYGFKPDYEHILRKSNSLNNIKLFYKNTYNTLKCILENNHELNKDKDILNNYMLLLTPPDLIKLTTINEINNIYNLIIQLLQIWFGIYKSLYYDEYNQSYKKENKTNTNLDYSIIDKNSINFWNYFYNINITKGFINLFDNILLYIEKTDDISDFNKCSRILYDKSTIKDIIELNIINIPKYTTSFRKGKLIPSLSTINIDTRQPSSKIKPNLLSRSAGPYSSIGTNQYDIQDTYPHFKTDLSKLSIPVSDANIEIPPQLPPPNKKINGGNHNNDILNIKYKQFYEKYYSK